MKAVNVVSSQLISREKENEVQGCDLVERFKGLLHRDEVREAGAVIKLVQKKSSHN